MRSAHIEREPSCDEGTFGKLTTDSGFNCESLELPWHNNQRGISCVPVGGYKCSIYDSPKHGKVYLLQDVPTRSACEIHPANFAGDYDKGWEADLEGCITLGTQRSFMHNRRGINQQCVINSRIALGNFMDDLNGEDFMLTITNRA